jgi:hypothetical protein
MTQEQLRMQMLAGIITEGQYKVKLNENDEYSLVKQEFETSPNKASYNQVLDVINGFEGAGDEEKIKDDFITRFSNSPSLSKEEYMDFLQRYSEGGDEVYHQMNWVSIFDPSIYDLKLTEDDMSNSVNDETYEKMNNLINDDDYDNFINSATKIMKSLMDNGFEVKDIFHYLQTRLTAEV